MKALYVFIHSSTLSFVDALPAFAFLERSFLHPDDDDDGGDGRPVVFPAGPPARVFLLED